MSLVACGGGGDTTIDKTFDPCALSVTTDAVGVQRAGIADALALWGFANTDGGERVVVEFREAAPAFRGLYDDEIGRVFVNQRITEPRILAIVIAHELGHAFGLPHITDRDSLMNPGNISIGPTAEDRAAVSALWGTCDAPPRS